MSDVQALDVMVTALFMVCENFNRYLSKNASHTP